MNKLTLADTLTIAGIGVVAGSRAMLAPALVSRHLQHTKDLADKTSHNAIRFNKASIWTVLSAGELLGDKMPTAPDRINPAGLIGRGISGGIAGASVSRQLKTRQWVGALIGSATALGATYLTWYVRKQIVKNTKVPDSAVGLAEDVLMLCLGTAALKRIK